MKKINFKCIYYGLIITVTKYGTKYDSRKPGQKFLM